MQVQGFCDVRLDVHDGLDNAAIVAGERASPVISRRSENERSCAALCEPCLSIDGFPVLVRRQVQMDETLDGQVRAREVLELNGHRNRVIYLVAGHSDCRCHRLVGEKRQH